MRSKKRISKKVFKELAAKNVKKSAKDYFIYFFTLTFAVCLFYTFNSIKDQFEILGIPDTFNYLAASQRKKRMYRLWKKKSEATGILQKVTGFPRFLWEEAPLPVWKRLRQSGFFRQ